jgi:hypothetical protein
VRRAVLLLAAVLAALLVAAPAGAATIVKQTREGRPVTFDVRVSGVDVEWYAELLRNAAHGDEIRRVTIRIVPEDDIRRFCGAHAGGCYGGSPRAGRIVVPAGRSLSIAHTLLHEYAHHLDRSTRVQGAPEPNGTPHWYRARGIARLVRDGRAAHGYARGWERSVGEIFAEDYVQLHLQTSYRIRWLDPPGPAVRAALRRDLPRAPAQPVELPRTPLVVIRAGSLEQGKARVVPFGLLDTGRRVTFVATAGNASRTGVRGRIELRCDSGLWTSRPLGPGAATARLDLRDLGPDRCAVAVRSLGATPLTFTAKLRLTIEPDEG